MSSGSNVKQLFPGAGGWITAVILTMPVRQVSLLSFGGANVRLGDVVLVFAVAVWMGTLLLGRRARSRTTGLDRAILLFVLACAVSLLWSQQSDHGWIRVSKLIRNLALYGMLVAYLSHDFAAGFRRLALALVAAGLLQSMAFAYSIGQYGGAEALSLLADAESLMSNDSRLAVVKTENGAGLLLRGAASWLGLCLFFGIGVVHLVRSRFRRRFIWVSVALMAALTVLTMSRSAWVALFTGGLATLAFMRPASTLKFGSLALFTGIVAWVTGVGSTFTNILAGRLGSEALANDPSLVDRWDYIALAVASFERSPWIGGGAAGIDPNEFITVHNVYLQVLGELGILGVLIFGAVLVLWLRALFSVWRQSRLRRDDGTRRIVAAMAGITVFFLTYFLAGHDLESSEPWIVMAVSSALLSVRSKAVTAPRPRPAQSMKITVTEVPEGRLT